MNAVPSTISPVSRRGDLDVIGRDPACCVARAGLDSNIGSKPLEWSAISDLMACVSALPHLLDLLTRSPAGIRQPTGRPRQVQMRLSSQEQTPVAEGLRVRAFRSRARRHVRPPSDHGPRAPRAGRRSEAATHSQADLTKGSRQPGNSTSQAGGSSGLATSSEWTPQRCESTWAELVSPKRTRRHRPDGDLGSRWAPLPKDPSASNSL